MSSRNDKGKTVKEMRKINTSYRRVGRGKQQYRCIELKVHLVLTGEKTEPSGFEGTLQLIDNVGGRAIQALAEEFLP